MNNDLRQNIIECAENMYIMANVEDMESKYRTYLLSNKQKNSAKYQCYPLPKVWLHPVGIELFVDAHMYLLLLRIMKDVHWMTMKW